MADVISRFLKYAKIDTKSDEASKSCPSTEKQLALARVLVEELQSIGLSDVSMDDKGYVMATLPANTKKKVPVIGFIAHMDTSPDMSGENVTPRFIENYDGSDIVLNKKLGIVMSPVDFPELEKYVGQTLITTDGTTLLGADNKAGIAEIMTALAWCVANPDFKHGTIKVGFTPDEEIGRGADHFDVKKFGAKYAYTVDGGELGELEFENFNAAKASITVNGRNVHPGTAKDKMINSMIIAMEFNGMLPSSETPSHTEGYEGFYHIIGIEGDVEKTSFHYILRDHDQDRFNERKNLVKKVASFLNNKYGKNTVKVKLVDQYYNMREKIEPVMHVIDIAARAMRESGVEPRIKPIRGGTDGARLSFMGLPTPNLFTGGHNYHGKYEYIPVESMRKAVDVIIKIIGLYGSGAVR
jgi:tripeptide aminopeptidase